MSAPPDADGGETWCEGRGAVRVTQARTGARPLQRGVTNDACTRDDVGGTAESIRAGSEQMQSNVGQGPPPGVKGTGFTMLADPEGGRVLTIGLFASEDDLRDSEPALKAMNPPEGLGNHTSTDVYEVAADVRT